MSIKMLNLSAKKDETLEINRIEGHRFGHIVNLDKDNQTIWVNYPGNPLKKDLAAVLGSHVITYNELIKTIETIGVVKLDFIDNHPGKPIIRDIYYSFLENQKQNKEERHGESLHVEADKIVLEAEKELTLKCGNTIINLKSEGDQLVIEAKNIKSSASKDNRIRGGNVFLN